MNSDEATRLIHATREQTTATLAAAIITASGRPWSIAQIQEIMRDINYAIHPAPSTGGYQEWAKTKDQRLSKIHGKD